MTKEQILNLVQNHDSFYSICKALNKPRSSVKYWFNKYDISTNVSGYIQVEKTINKCLTCSKETTNPRFCSQSCSASYNNVIHVKKKRNPTKCTKCENPTKSSRHTLCKNHLLELQEERKTTIRTQTLGDYWSRKSLENLHTSSKNVHIRLLARKDFKELTKQPCKNCGYTKHVELCHIKPINSFPETALVSEVNSRENIVQLCPNCHWELDNNLLELSAIQGSNL